MSDERELERHNQVLEQIEKATTREDLPSVWYPTINSYFASNVYFDNKRISQTLFQPVVDEIIKHGFVEHPSVKKTLIKVIVENYPNASEEDIAIKCKKVLEAKRIGYVLTEITQKSLKMDEIMKSENKKAHDFVMSEIRNANEIKDLPKVGLTVLNKKLTSDVNYSNDFYSNIKTSEMKELTDAYLNHANFTDVEKAVKNIVSKLDIANENKELMAEQIIGALRLDDTLDYIVEEIDAKEKRKYEIYKLDHEATMDAIKNANRISQLPPNLTISTVNGYLNGNTTLYKNDDRIKAEDLRKLTDLLMDGYKWDNPVIIEEVKKIAKEKYPEKEDAFDLLYSKFSALPKTYYYVEEVKYAQERQVEFIGRGSSNVNVYFIPNYKSPIEGGRFYNCYINRVDNLNLESILPLNLDEIVPQDMDIDAVEWYVQQKYDETFKTAGGIILNRDETIGNVSVFTPNDGTVGVAPEQKIKIEQIDDLDAQIEEKQKKLDELTAEVDAKENQSKEVEQRMQDALIDYEQKALALQMKLFEDINSIKKDLGIGAPGSGGRGL